MSTEQRRAASGLWLIGLLAVMVFGLALQSVWLSFTRWTIEVTALMAVYLALSRPHAARVPEALVLGYLGDVAGAAQRGTVWLAFMAAFGLALAFDRAFFASRLDAQPLIRVLCGTVVGHAAYYGVLVGVAGSSPGWLAEMLQTAAIRTSLGLAFAAAGTVVTSFGRVARMPTSMREVGRRGHS